MFLGLRSKKDGEMKDKQEGDKNKLPFVNPNGREDSLRASKEHASLLDALKNEPESPVKKIADKLGCLPPAIQSISDAKGSHEKKAAAQEYASRMAEVHTAVTSFLNDRRKNMEIEHRNSKEKE